MERLATLNPDEDFLGKKRALVKDRKDPRKLGRVKLLVPEVFGLKILTTWAYPVMPYGGIPDNGDFKVPELESQVQCEFESGNPDRPMYTGCTWAEPPGDDGSGGNKKPIPEPPKLARGDADESTMDPKGTDETVAADGTEVKEPKSPFAALYPQNKVFKSLDSSESGSASPDPKKAIILEIDDTIDEDGNPQKRIHIWHPTATYSEVGPDGSKVERIMGERRYCVVIGLDELHVLGAKHTIVDGDCTLKVGGDYTVLVEGDMIQTVKGKVTEVTDGTKDETVKGATTEAFKAGRTTDITGDDKRTASGALCDSGSPLKHN